MLGVLKSMNTAENLFLHLRFTQYQLAEQFPSMAFRQPPPETQQGSCENTPENEKRPEHAPYSKGELMAAIMVSMRNTAPAIDGITMAATRTISEEGFDKLLWVYNHTRACGRTGPSWKVSRTNYETRQTTNRNQEPVPNFTYVQPV